MAIRKKTEIYETKKVEDIKLSPEKYKALKIVKIAETSTVHGDKLTMAFQLKDGTINQIYLNAPSQNALIDAFGQDDARWIGEKVDLTIYSGKETKNNPSILVIPCKK